MCMQMLRAGLRALRPGGRLVYSTCSLADLENDHVVQKALEQLSSPAGGSAACSCEVVPVVDWGIPDAEQLAGGERTQHGLLCLPDKQGWGPIYVAMIEKPQVDNGSG